MRRAQTSVEYLLLTAGVILVGVIASQAVVSSGTVTHEAIKEEINNIVPVDSVPPTTDIVCDGLACYGKYNKSVNIGFVCRDNLGGSGCAVTHYEVHRAGIGTVASGDCNQIAANCQTVYTLAEPPAGTKYTYTITFYSVDLNGNVESPPHTVTIEIGKAGTGGSALLAKCDVNHTPAWPKPGGSLDITAIATADSLYNAEINISSPVGKTYPCGSTITNVTPCKITGIPLPGAPSTYVLTVSVEGNDSFGNQGVCGSENVVVDGLPPNVSVSDPDPCKWYRADFDVKFHASDPTYSSYIDSWVYTIEDGVAPEYTSGTISLSPAQTHDTVAPVTVGPGKYCSTQGKQTCKVTGEFEDRAGNSGSASERFSIDYTAPTITATLPAAGWVNQPIHVTLKCTDAPSNGSGCKAIYWVFVDPDASCPAPGSGGWQSKTFPPTGCPEEWNITETATATLDCDLCTRDICYYAEDGAGNISAVGRSTLSNDNGIRTDGSYAIDKVKPTCQISFSKEFVDETKNGWAGPNMKNEEAGIAGAPYWGVECTDTGSGLRQITMTLNTTECADCELYEPSGIQLSLFEQSVSASSATVDCSGKTCTITLQEPVDKVSFTLPFYATEGGVCISKGLSVTVSDYAGNENAASAQGEAKIDWKDPTKPSAYWDLDPAGAIPKSPVCESYCYGSWGGWYKTVYFTLDSEDSGCNSGVAWLCIQPQDGVLVGGNPNSGTSPHYWATIDGTTCGADNINYTTSPTRKWGFSLSAKKDFEGILYYNGTQVWVMDDVLNSSQKQKIYGWCLDGKAPEVTLDTDKDTYYVKDEIKVTVQASDNGSGLKKISISDSGGEKTYPCGTKSATYQGSLTATCQDAVSGKKTITAEVWDQVENKATKTKEVTVKCDLDSDCSCVSETTCYGNTEYYYPGKCGDTCYKSPTPTTTDCSSKSCPDIITECTCGGSGCIVAGYHQDPACVDGTGCTCVLGDPFTKNVASCPP